MKIRHFAVAVSSITLLLSAPMAQAGVGKGDLEAGVNVSITNTETTVSGTSTESDTGVVGGSIGYFFTDIFEAKAAISAIISSSGGTKTTYGIFSPGLDAVFLGTKKVAPFVGASYGLAFGDQLGPVDSDYFEGHAGVKFFIKERASLEAKLTKYEPTDSAATSGRLELAVGLNLYF